MAGSPFASGLTLDSCAGISLAATPDGNFLMASSNGTIATFAINPTTGALSPASSVTGLPVPMVGMKISGNGQLLAVSHESSWPAAAARAVPARSRVRQQTRRSL